LSIREHRHEIIIFGIMAAVSFTIALAMTGDLQTAFAHCRGR